LVGGIRYTLEGGDTKDREIKSLLTAMTELSMDTGYIYTWNQEETLKINEKIIKIVPFWKESLTDIYS
jgi:hypothetical protein